MSRIRFGEALSTLVRLCETHPAFRAGNVERACVVRDLRGRLRLAVKPASQAAVDVDTLAATLRDGLGGYFHGPVLEAGVRNRPDEARLAAKLLELSETWEASYRDPFTDQPHQPPVGRWRKLERRLAKQTWLDEKRPGPPWELGKGPPVVTFYSFKGGVGRTTALASCAWQLARAGKRVAVLDLDLEGPGIGALLDADAGHGVLDFLVDYLATERRDLDSLTSRARALGDVAEKVDVVTAGQLDLDFLEKLARLDFQSSLAQEGESPIETALRALLHAARQELRPDVLFLDARSGLHDLSGLSLHGLAHVDVVFTRASRQSYLGFDLTVEALARRREPEDLLAVVVHAFAPTDPTSRLYELEFQEVLESTYEVFCKHVYGDEPPALEDRTAPHRPLPLRAVQELERFASLSGVESSLFSSDYSALCDRIVELSETQDEEEDE